MLLSILCIVALQCSLLPFPFHICVCLLQLWEPCFLIAHFPNPALHIKSCITHKILHYTSKLLNSHIYLSKPTKKGSSLGCSFSSIDWGLKVKILGTKITWITSLALPYYISMGLCYLKYTWVYFFSISSFGLFFLPLLMISFYFWNM